MREGRIREEGRIWLASPKESGVLRTGQGVPPAEAKRRWGMAVLWPHYPGLRGTPHIANY